MDGNLKLWDLRQAAAPVAQQAPHAQLAQLCSTPLPSIGLKQHGITSLALHPNGEGSRRSKRVIWVALGALGLLWLALAFAVICMPGLGVRSMRISVR